MAPGPTRTRHRRASANIAPTPTPTPTATPTSTPFPAGVTLNEILPDPQRVDWDQNGVADFVDEWIELYNGSPAPAALGGWAILDDTKAYTLPLGLTIWPQSHLLLYPPRDRPVPQRLARPRDPGPTRREHGGPIRLRPRPRRRPELLPEHGRQRRVDDRLRGHARAGQPPPPTSPARRWRLRCILGAADPHAADRHDRGRARRAGRHARHRDGRSDAAARAIRPGHLPPGRHRRDQGLPAVGRLSRAGRRRPGARHRLDAAVPRRGRALRARAELPDPARPRGATPTRSTSAPVRSARRTKEN